MQQDVIVRPDPATDPLGAYLHAEFERLFAIEFPQGNSNAVRSPPAIPAHVQTGDRSPVARHLSVESAK